MSKYMKGPFFIIGDQFEKRYIKIKRHDNAVKPLYQYSTGGSDKNFAFISTKLIFGSVDIYRYYVNQKINCLPSFANIFNS